MWLKKIISVLGAFTCALTISVSASAENLVPMGYPTDKRPDGTNYGNHIAGWDLFRYDRDSMYVDKENNIIEVSLHSESCAIVGEMYAISRVRMYFSPDPKQCYFKVLYEDAYNSKKRERHLRHVDKGPSGEEGLLVSLPLIKCKKNDFSTSINENYMPYVFWKEFAYYLGLPNQNGTKYVTPKDLGLTWAVSDDNSGIFYFPESVRVYDNLVGAIFCAWRPNENMYQLIGAAFDYTEDIAYITFIDTRRISTGDMKREEYKTEKNKKPKGIAFHIDSDIQLAAEYFRNYLK